MAKKGLCVECEAEKYLANASKKLCYYHNEKRKRLEKKKKLEEKGEYMSEVEVFNRIWDSRPRVSFLSGSNLSKYPRGSKVWYSLFAHVLSKAKGKYYKMKYNEENIVLLTPVEHRLYDQGNESERQYYAEVTGCNWDKLYDLRDKLKEEYKKLE